MFTTGLCRWSARQGSTEATSADEETGMKSMLLASIPETAARRERCEPIGEGKTQEEHP